MMAPQGSPDMTIECADCARPFTFTAAEQQFYEARNFATPKRCRPCLRSRREWREKHKADDERLSAAG